jgi:hypothetical protein
MYTPLQSIGPKILAKETHENSPQLPTQPPKSICIFNMFNHYLENIKGCGG